MFLSALGEQAVLAASPVSKGGVTIGSLCLDGVRGKSDPARANPKPDGTWVPWTYELDPARRSRAGLFIFDTTLPDQEALLSCEEIALEAEKAGIHLLLAGTIQALPVLNAQLFRSNNGGGNRFQIDARQFRATLSRVQSGAITLAGGTMPLAGAQLYVENVTRVLALPDRLEGTLQIEAWNRNVMGATMTLPGGVVTTADLAPITPNTENVTVHLDLATRLARFWKARMRSTSLLPFAAPELALGPVVLREAALEVQNVEILTTAGLSTASLHNLAGTARTASFARDTDTAALDRPTLHVKELTSVVEVPPGQGLVLQALSSSGVALESDRGEVKTTGNAVLVRGSVKAHFAKLDSKTVEGSMDWSRPALPALSFLVSSEATETLHLEVSGAPSGLKIQGKLGASRFNIGRVEISQGISLPFTLGAIGVEIRIPLVIALPPVGSSVTIRDDDQEALLSASITEGNLSGVVVLQSPELERSRLEVPAGGLHLSLASTVATKPFMAGATPTFASAGVMLTNATPLAVGKETTGTLTISSDLLALGQPIIRVGEKGKEARATLALAAQGIVRIGLDLATGHVALLSGRFAARDVELALLDPSATIELSGTLVSAPRIKLRELSLVANDELAEFSMAGLAIDASHVSHPQPADRPSEVAFEATPAAPIKLDRMSGSATLGDSLTFLPVTFSGFSLDLRDAAVQFGTDVTVGEARLTVSAVSVSVLPQSNPVQYVYQDVSFRASGRLSVSGEAHINDEAEFEISATASGLSDRLSGMGTAKVGAFTGWATSSIPAEAFCKLNIPVEYNYASGGAALDVAVREGNFVATGNLAPLGVLLKSTSGASCDTEPEEFEILPEKWVSTSGVCCAETKCLGPVCGCVRYEGCEWKTKLHDKVALRWHKRFEVDGLGVTATLTNPLLQLEDGRLRVCNRGVVSIASLPGGVLWVGGVSPQVDSSVPQIDEVLRVSINPIVFGSFVLAQSALATELAQGVGFLASSLATPTGNLLCLGQQ
ncbi:MAG: hypothetical protein U0002_21555 [Thermoanaerobaculia bacterium]